MTFDAQTLATIGVITGAIVQGFKSLPFVQGNKDLLPLVSLVVGGLVGFGSSFLFPEVDWIQGIFAGLVASGGYDAISSTVNRVKK